MKQSAIFLIMYLSIINSACTYTAHGRDIDRWIVKSWGKDKQRISNYRNK